MKKILAVVLLCLLIAAQAIATCTYTVIGQGSSNNANTCPNGTTNTYFVDVLDKIRWSDQLNDSLVEVHYNDFRCGIDDAVITRSSGTFIDDTSEPWIDWSYYKIELAYRSTNVPNAKFVVDEIMNMSCARQHPSPVVISRDQAAFDLTSPESGVTFDLALLGTPQRIAWTKAKADVWFLITGTNVINGAQLWGNQNPQAPPIEEGETENGFRALRAVDSNGDMRIDAKDPIWQQLHLWRDSNHNGVSEPEEVKTMAQVGVLGIRLEYHDKLGKRDQYGSLYSQRVKVDMADGSTRWATDFYPASSFKPDSVTEQVIPSH